MSSSSRTFGFSAAALLAVIALYYPSCQQDFIGRNVPKAKKQATVSPNEEEPPRAPTRPEGSSWSSRSGSASGGYSGYLYPPSIVTPEAIEIEVIQSSSESWWRNCLLARTMYSPSWVRVSCNKGNTGLGGKAKLPGIRGTCNAVSIRIETYRNQGDTCAVRQSQGLSCEGPYADVPDTISEPRLDSATTTASKTSAFSLYHAGNLQSPDPLIMANGGWQLPSFQRLSGDMNAWKQRDPRNRWFRFFFEDQGATSISTARQQPARALELGVDYNDYVFDIRSQAIEIGVSGTSLACP